MNLNTFALYTTSINDIQINNLKKYLYNKYPYSSFHIFADINLKSNNDTSVLPSFYMKFYKGCLIFDNLLEYVKEYENILSSDIFILSDEKYTNVPKKEHQNVKIINLEIEEFL
jgi:hypothetical protein